ncbi:MAG TPA: hypothetical protein VF942_06580, partial [Acidimicrobiales bacterium]
MAGKQGKRPPRSGRKASTDLKARTRAEQVQVATYRISEAAHTAPTLSDLFRAIHGIVGELMPAKNFYIALHDADSDMVSFPYFVDEHDPLHPPKKVGRGLTEYVLRTGQTRGPSRGCSNPSSQPRNSGRGRAWDSPPCTAS